MAKTRARRRDRATGAGRTGDSEGVQPFKVLQAHDSQIGRLTLFQNDTRLITTSFDGTAKVWDTATWQQLIHLRGHSEFCRTVRVLPDNQHALSCGNDGKLIYWDLKSGEGLNSYEIEDARWIFDVQVLPDSQLAIIGADGSDPARIIDPITGTVLRVLPVTSETIYSLLLVPGTRTVVLGGSNGFLEIWNYDSGMRVSGLSHEGNVHGLALSSDSTRLIASGDRTVGVWELPSGRQLSVFEGFTGRGIFSVAVSPSDRFVIAGTIANRENGEIVVWTLDTGSISMLLALDGDVAGVAAPATGNFYITGHTDGTLRFWEMPGAETRAAAPLSARYVNAKVVLLGESGVGKTCLARALMREPFQPQESTHGMKVWNFSSETLDEGDSGRLTREIMLWDLAGQVDYRIVHQLFLDETVLGIVMFDATDPVDPFRGVGHWDKALTRVAGEATPRILVAGRTDRGHPAVSERDLEAFREQHGYTHFVPTSAKTGDGVDEVRQAIQGAIGWNSIPVVTSPELWRRVREHLLERRRLNPVLTTRRALRKGFQRKHPGALVSERDFDTVMAHAQAQGLVWRLSFGDAVLMKPELLNGYAAAVVRAARGHPLGLGCVAEREVLEGLIDFEDLRRLPASIEKKLVYAVVELFLDREVAFRGGPTDELIVFPSKFNRERPDYPDAPAREVAYAFAGSIEDIYATLVVRLAHSEAFAVKDLFKNAAEYVDARRRICGIQLEQPAAGQAVLSAFFAPETSVDTKVLFLRFIHEHLRRRAIPSSVVRQRIYRCRAQECGEEVTDRRAIEAALKRTAQRIPCQYCEGSVELVDALETEFGDPTLRARVRAMDEQVAERRAGQVGATVSKAKDDFGEFDVFLAHHSPDKPYVNDLAAALRLYGLNPWLDDEQIPPGRWFQDVLQRAIRHVRAAAIIIGTTGLGRWETIELRSFISQCVEREVPVIPVLLPDVARVPEELVFLRELNFVRFRDGISDRDALDRLVWGITGERPRRTSETLAY